MVKEQSKYTDRVFWVKNGYVLFEQDFKSGILYVNYYTLWEVFKDVFNLEYYEISELIKELVWKHLKGCNLQPSEHDIYRWARI